MHQILCFGDSNTWGLRPEGGRYPLHERWTGILQQELGYDRVHVVEEGLCGRTTIFEDELRPRRCGMGVIPMVLESHSPIQISILMLGTNDCKSYFGASARQIGEGMERIVNLIKAFDPGIRILLISPIHLGERVFEEGFDREFNRESVAKSRELKKVYGEIASRLGVEFLAASDYVSPSAVDMEHLDKESHRILAEAIREKVSEML